MVILDPKKGVRFGLCEKLEDFYREIECDTIDIARRNIGGKAFDIFLDDEGLLKDDPQISAVSKEKSGIKPQLVGTLVFTQTDGQGNTIDISLEDTMMITSHIKPLRIQNRDTGEVTTNYVVVLDEVGEYDIQEFLERR